MSEGASSNRPMRRVLLAVATVLAVVATFCAVTDDSDETTSSSAGPEAEDDDEADGTDQDPRPFRIQLREGTADPTATDGDDVAQVTGTGLDPTRIAEITGRLDPLESEADDQQDFSRPPESLPPPTTGEALEVAFPLADTPTSTATPDSDGPLEVLRVQPDGAVDIAPFLAVTFNQPMIPLATLDQLDQEDVPVTVSPELDGRWRWLGTRTVRFEHSQLDGAPVDGLDRLPMATEYTVTIPAGTTSETGGVLAEDVTFSFSTPPPTVTQFGPQSDSLPLEPVFVATFDQQVEPEAVIDRIILDADGERPVRIATADEIEADETASDLVARAQDRRWVAFRPVDPLPPDTRVRVDVGEGTPSAEGPLTTTSARSFTGQTYPALRILRGDCGRGSSDCGPGSALVLQLSNPLDPASIDPDQVTVEPDVPGVQVVLEFDNVIVRGATQPNTTYEVTLPAELTDQFGQTLGEPASWTFGTGDPRPFVRQPGRELVTLDPLAEQPSLSLVSAGHEEFRVVAYDVSPDDWPAYWRELRRSEELREPDFPVHSDRMISTGAEDAGTVETVIDLSDVLPDGTGHVVLLIEPERTFPRNSEQFWENRPFLIWVQATTVGIDVISDADMLLAWATDLRDGQPMADAEVAYAGSTGLTDGQGRASLQLDGTGAEYLTVTTEGQAAILPSGWPERWVERSQIDETRWHVFDDRGLYRPGETVHLKGWVRELQLSGDADLALLPENTTMSYQVYDGQFVELEAGEVTLNRLGGFDLEIELPAGANLGFGAVQFQLIENADGLANPFWEHPLRIEEFRRPEFEVTTQVVSPEPNVLTRPVTVQAEASFFSGGALPAAPVTWTVTNQPTSYNPPGWREFTFGRFIPWWRSGGFGQTTTTGAGFEDGFGPGFGPGPDDRASTEVLTGITDASGRHQLDLTFEGDTPDEPLLVSANATVEDVNRQAFSSTSDLLVHAGERYIGLRSDRAFVRQGDPLRIQTILTDIDGEVIPDQDVELVAERLVISVENGEQVETGVDAQTCTVTTSLGPVECEFDTEVGGQYRVWTTATDDGGGTNRTELEIWVSGAEAVPSRDVTQDQLTLIPSQQEYHAGDVAEILVPAPFSPATGLVTLSRNGITSTQVVDVVDGSAIVEIPVTDEMVPGITVQVDLVGSAPRVLDDGSPAPDLPDRPAFAAGQIELAVPPTTRALTVQAEPEADRVLPGTQTAVEVTVTGPDGAAVEGADVALAVVDDAVLSLVDYQLADPLDSFYRPLGSFLDSEYLRHTIQLARADAVGSEGRSSGEDAAMEDEAAAGAATAEAMTDDAMDEEESAGDAAAGTSALAAPAVVQATGGQGAPPIEVRSNFDALAVFAPEATTDAQGRATVQVDLPDSLTRYRVIAVAAAGEDQFGSDESTLEAALPVQVRPSPPRLANFGDTFEFPVVVQNTTEEEVTAEVVLEVTNLEATDTGLEVSVPAGDRVEVRFPISVADAGTARFRTTVVAGDATDSASGDFPVYTPATSESFATYGVLDGGVVSQPVLSPTDVVPQFGGLEVTTSSTALQSLTDALLYLTTYEYDSSDALASRVLAIAALRDVLAAFDASLLPSAGEIEATVASDLEGLAGLQNPDGGWPVWQRGRSSEPFHSIQATHALLAARAAGYAVPEETLRRGLELLQGIENIIHPRVSETTRQSLRAYAVHVRNLAGDPDPARAVAIYRALQDASGGEPGALPLDAVAWLWPVLDTTSPDGSAVDAEIEVVLGNRVTETPSAATFTTGYGEDGYLVLGSDRRTDGIILDALLDRRPDSDLIVKVVNGLLANQRQGRWTNVQENAFILLAVKRYFDTFEATPPDFVARVWLGDLYAAEHTFEGRSTDSSLTVIPTSELLAAADDPGLVIQQDGEGRLYYRLGLQTAPASLQVDARDEGFVVQRVYEPVGDPEDVIRDDDGIWRIRAGAQVRVRVSLVADSRRVNMALVDPLPAGLEPVNPALAASPAPPPEPDEPEAATEGPVASTIDVTFIGPWFEHQNLRDDRAEAFSGLLQGGTYEYTYIARATTPGTFVVPPTVAEEIYTPEVFGRTATDTVVID